MCGPSNYSYTEPKLYNVVIPEVGEREDAEKIANAISSLTEYTVRVVEAD